MVTNDVYSKVYVIILASINFFFMRNSFFVLYLSMMRFIIEYLIKYFSWLSNLLFWQNFCGEKSHQLVRVSSGGSNERRKCHQLKFHMHSEKISTISTMNYGGRAWNHTRRKWFVRNYMPRKHGPIKKLFTCSNSAWRIIC